MLEQRSLRADLFALALLALTVFLAAALLSYNPADPPSKLVFPERAQTLNVCGRYGALASTFLFSALGLGAYYLLISLAVLDAMHLARRPITDPVLRIVGWMISLVGVTALAAMAVPWLAPGPVIGAGGYLGAAIRGLLELNFARVGSFILAVSLLLAGLLLCTEYLVMWVAAIVVRGPILGLIRGVRHVLEAYAARLGLRKPLAAKASDVASAEENQVEVRISGRSAAEVDDDEEELDDEDDDEDEDEADLDDEDDDDEDEAAGDAANAGGKKSLAAMFFGRKPKREIERQEVIKELHAAAGPVEQGDYKLPTSDLLKPGEPYAFEEQEKEVRRKAKVLEKTFRDFGLNVRVVEIQTGPVIAQFEVELEAGLRLSKVTSLADDVAIALRVPSVRIVAPIPGKNTVGVEVPNTNRQLVRMREVIEEANGQAQKMRIPLYLGKDVAGNPMVADLTTLPHLLIAGRTGTGKSVCLNTIIVSMLMTRRPDEVRMLMIDPKMVELSAYKSLPHLMHPVVTDMRKAEAILAWAVEKMEERYQLLARAGVRHLSAYNQLGEEELLERIRPESDEERGQIPRQMPYIVIVADEMADMMMTAAKEVEGHIIRLAQKSRAVGIHLVLATQKPTVDVITGLIKSNLPARISFQVASRTDSRVVLDEMGADKLLGNGDMLFLHPNTSVLIRGQGTYLEDGEINKVIGAVATSEPQFVHELVELKTSDEAAEAATAGTTSSKDDLYDQAVEIVIREGRGSVSLLQRALGIGYGRAARLVDFMAEDGIVGSYNGSQAREVTITLDQWQTMRSGGGVPNPQQVLDAGPRRAAPKILLATHGNDAQDDGLSPAVALPAKPASPASPSPVAPPKRQRRKRPLPPRPKVVKPLEESPSTDDLEEAAPWEDDRQRTGEVEDWQDDGEEEPRSENDDGDDDRVEVRSDDAAADGHRDEEDDGDDLEDVDDGADTDPTVTGWRRTLRESG